MLWKLAVITVPLALAGGVAQAGSFVVVPAQYDFYAEEEEYESGYDEYYDEPDYVPQVRIRRPRPSTEPEFDAVDTGPRSSTLCGGRFNRPPKHFRGRAKQPASTAPTC